MAKKIFLGCIAAVFIAGILTFAVFEINRKSPHVYYNIKPEEGYIIGEQDQKVKKGKDSSEVTVKANDGYIFIGWSDGLTEPTRKETNVKNSTTITAVFEKLFKVNYLAQTGGYIEGDVNQKIQDGHNAESITVKAYDGYEFAGWSDMSNNHIKEDTITRNVTYTAYFRKLIKAFKYNYNGATSNNMTQNVTLLFNDVNHAEFVIPQKTGYIFDGWFLEDNFTTKVADSNGVYMLGYRVFDTDIESENLYAKWVKDKESNEIVYKILLVFVDEIHATLKDTEGADVNIDYKMSPLERKVCKMVKPKMLGYLNEWFEGLVRFEIDMYFTTEALSTIHFEGKIVSNGILTPSIYANTIHEMFKINPNYRSVITTYRVNNLSNYAGLATKKYACIDLENCFKPSSLNGDSVDIWLDESYYQWDYFINTYLHEFTHTAESYYDHEDNFDFHEVVYFYSQTYGDHGLTPIKLYLLNQAVIDGETVGIPFSYWQGDFEIFIAYYTNEFDHVGLINGEQLLVFTIKFGGDAIKVTATAGEGYRFVAWSDGVTTPTRHDKNIVEYTSICAIFEKIE